MSESFAPSAFPVSSLMATRPCSIMQTGARDNPEETNRGTNNDNNGSAWSLMAVADNPSAKVMQISKVPEY